jgi:DNA end-binding protein Ku
MPRPVLSITLSFGLVSIPVRLYAAAISKRVTFHLLDRATGRRVRQQFVSTPPPSRESEDEADELVTGRVGAGGVAAAAAPSVAIAPDGHENADDKPVATHRVLRQQLVKGFETGRDEHVEITPDELKALEAEANEHAEIEEFVPLGGIDPLYFDKAYYLGPDKGGEKVYRLFARALHEQQRAAIVKLVMRGKEKLAVVRPTAAERLVLETLHYADEVRDVSEIPLPEVHLNEAEVRLAGQVIGSRAVDAWQPDRYHDTYRERVLALIEQKRQGRPARAPSPEGPPPVIDLMEALRRSLVSAEKRPRRGAGASPAAGRSSRKVTRTG